MLKNIRVGIFLGLRFLLKSNRWSTLLIIFIMTLTFLNVVVVRGVLVGLPAGSFVTYREGYAGEVLVKPLVGEKFIKQPWTVTAVAKQLEDYRALTDRFTVGGRVQADFKQLPKPGELPDEIGVTMAGIDPLAEEVTTDLVDKVVEGNFLDSSGRDELLIGHQLLEQYTVVGSEEETLAGVQIGDKVLVKVGGNKREFVVRGIVKSKVGENGRRLFLPRRTLQKMAGEQVDAISEVAISLAVGSDVENYIKQMENSGLKELATIETARESQGQFLEDITRTFEILSAVLGLIGVLVAATTIFIVIFIFALARQKQIGILKGIGINREAVVLAYIIMAVCYAVAGSLIGLVITYGLLVPYFDQNPIDFPFSDGLLDAPLPGSLFRVVMLIGTAMLAGALPAWLIVRRNTINSILGR